MDYSKVKYVKPSVDGIDITKDKVYSLIEKVNSKYRFLKDDVGYNIYVCIDGTACVHLGLSGRWIPCAKDGTPL